ncbi:MAG: class I tRNA ligase family protein, partial [Holosporaceae bacterium]|nr:class I tRNA ligase family protein [Holosporaceae bacterium]
DRYADITKGTGAVKITPAHDFNDFDVGQRHRLPIIDVMDAKGALNENVPEIFQKMDRFEARKKVAELLRKKKLLVKVENVKQMIPFGDRSGAVLEPKLTYQWFVNTEKLAEPAIRAVKDGKLHFVPKRWENLYFEWLNNIRPWCVSRQIWWGHRIPAWYGPDGQIFVEKTQEEAAAKATEYYGKNHIELIQDEDVLDTWFSSAMWPFVTLDWPEKTPDFKRFYSKMIIVTGFDIIFFWIARMVMMGIYATGEIPFGDVYIHGLVRDEKGRKMSKSKGNVIDPISLCQKYGADAVRYTLASLASPGRDLKMNDRLVETGRNFLTKMWNAVRFAQMNSCVYNRHFKISDVKSPIVKWMIYQTINMVNNVENSIENYRFDDATRYIYQCVWSSFCDWYMEFIKPILQKTSSNCKQNIDSISDKDEILKNNYDLNLTLLKKDIRDTTAWAILQFVRVLYPITPFISKKLSGEFGILDAEWPDFSCINIDFEPAVKEIEFLKNVITSIRSTKQYLRIPLTDKMNIRIETSDLNVKRMFTSDYSEILYQMAGVRINDISGQTIPVIIDNAIIHVEFEGKIDVNTEKRRLQHEIAGLTKMRNNTLNRLVNNDFLCKASEDIIEEHKRRVDHINDQIQKINYVLQSLDVV